MAAGDLNAPCLADLRHPVQLIAEMNWKARRNHCLFNTAVSSLKPDPFSLPTIAVADRVPARLNGVVVPPALKVSEMFVELLVELLEMAPVTVRARVPDEVFVIVPVPVTLPLPS